MDLKEATRLFGGRLNRCFQFYFPLTSFSSLPSPNSSSLLHLPSLSMFSSSISLFLSLSIFCTPPPISLPSSTLLSSSFPCFSSIPTYHLYPYPPLAHPPSYPPSLTSLTYERLDLRSQASLRNFLVNLRVTITLKDNVMLSMPGQRASLPPLLCGVIKEIYVSGSGGSPSDPA